MTLFCKVCFIERERDLALCPVCGNTLQTLEELGLDSRESGETEEQRSVTECD